MQDCCLLSRLAYWRCFISRFARKRSFAFVFVQLFIAEILTVVLVIANDDFLLSIPISASMREEDPTVA